MRDNDIQTTKYKVITANNDPTTIEAERFIVSREGVLLFLIGKYAIAALSCGEWKTVHVLTDK